MLVLVLVVAGLGYKAVQDAFPQHDGTLTVKGLSAPVTVHRDQWGIPQLYAKTEADLMRAQGYVHAQDRFWEMDFRRHVTAGRVSELFGDGQVETDTYLRTMGWRRVAEQEWPLLSEPTQGRADGLRRGRQRVAGRAPASAATQSLEYSILGLQNPGLRHRAVAPGRQPRLAQGDGVGPARQHGRRDPPRAALLAKGLTKEQVDQLYPAYPFDRNVPIVPAADGAPSRQRRAQPRRSTPPGTAGARSADAAGAQRGSTADLAALPGLMGNADGDGIGSNSWVISRQLTATGKPILANDPHLAPSHARHLVPDGPALRVRPATSPGFTFSGVPGVVIGHNARIAWGFTNLGPDVIDLYLEQSTATRSTDGTLEPLPRARRRIKVAGRRRRDHHRAHAASTARSCPTPATSLRKLGSGKARSRCAGPRWTRAAPATPVRA